MIDRARDATILVVGQPPELNPRYAEAGAGVAFTFSEAVERALTKEEAVANGPAEP